MKILSTMAAIAALFTAAIPAASSAQVVQVRDTLAIRCYAQSSYALGIGVSTDGNAACRRALYECAIRTPAGYNCYVVRSEYVYV